MHASERRFLLAGLAVLLPGLLALGLANAWLDPFGYFGRPLRRGLTDVPSTAFDQAPRPQQLRWLAQRARETPAAEVLVGTSRLRYGLDTCAAPGVQRIALLALSLREMTWLAPALADAPGLRSLSFELSVPGEPVASADPGASGLGDPAELRRQLFGWTATQVGLTTLWRSRAAAFDGRCGVDVRETDWRPDHPGKALGSDRLIALSHDAAALVEQQRALGELLEAYGPGCASRGQRLQVFTLPAYVPRERLALLLQAQERQAEAMEAVLARYRPRYPGCTLALLDLASPYTRAYRDGLPAEDWRDGSHFAPARGAAFLAALRAR
ncbi:hypothetical protein [Pseudomonas mangiferae]|uniref:Uncharacterized protein n=1 Tax=Pseudomonas mangiferae TaxID=2593654 RepID=A0A553H0E1_9PSED|nr:hypothetical protein [Pseudomonas mangiferae]TRX75183.1 hypothetical protein FM069_08765 [Pseudomonas mangiferae]